MNRSQKFLQYLIRCKKSGTYAKKSDCITLFGESTVCNLLYYGYVENCGDGYLQITLPGEDYYRNEKERAYNRRIAEITLAVSIAGIVLQLLLWLIP